MLSGGDLNPPGPIGPPPASGGLAPPTNGGAAEGATLDARHTAPAGARRFAFAPAGAGPAADFSECAPQGGAHTEKSNPVRPLGYPPGRRRPGGHAAGSTDAPAPIPPPFPRGERGRGVTDPLRRGRGLLSSHCLPVAPFVAHHDIRVSLPRQGPQKFSLGNFLLFPLTRQRPADVPATPNGKTKTERKDPSMKNFDEIIKESVLNIITSMTDAEIRNLVETWMLEYGDGVACMIADRVRKIAESVLFDLPF